MADIWYTLLSTACAKLYFSKVEIIGKNRLPANRPTLLVGLHRNGAVDGWIYKTVFPGATFLIAAQLRKNLLAKLFFTGISVVRDKDEGKHTLNAEAMAQCHELIARGGVLAIFPEGTSTLGPRHLPFKSGSARTALEAWNRRVPLTVVPLGITYDAPSKFRSRVQVLVGRPIREEELASRSVAPSLEDVKLLITTRLEEVGINVDSDEHWNDLARSP